MLGYNQTFHVNFDTSADKFQNYYKDLSQRVKSREVDLLIVVNMFLTGFDAATLNTLWVDKNLKMHGLIQAFSRTNQILNSVKTYGNIVCFRNLQKATDDAIALFGDREASGVVLLKGYDAYYDGYEENGKAVPGYRKGEDGKPELVPEEAAIVERIFEMLLAGQPEGLIAQTLQSENIEIPGKDLSFSKNMIMNILRNEKYCGDSILQKTVTVDCISKTRKANHGEAPMYLVENSHPAIISRDIFHRTQEELARRKALRLKSEKTAITKTGKYSKYALSEVLHCAECGSRYKRVTWNIRGKKKIVWRCVSRLDYGKKYCKDSVTVEEAALHGAVVRALNRFHAEDESTYLTLMKATIGEAIGINGGSEEIDLLTRRIDALNKRMLELVNETVAAGKDVESSEDEFKSISDQIEQLNRRIAAIQESVRGDATRQARLEEIQSIIAKRNANETQYDDSIVRQMIECIKVYGDGRLTIIFGGGYEIEETL